MRLTDLERRVLAAAHLNALDPLPALYRASGVRPHQIRYCLDKYLDLGVIRRRVILDVTKLNEVEHSIALSVVHENESSRSAFAEFLTRHPRTVDLHMLGGNYDFLVVLCAKSSSELLQFLREAAQVPGSRVVAKAVSTRVISTLYRRKFLSKSKGQNQFFRYGETGERVQLDELDRRVLNQMIPMQFQSLRELGRGLGISHTALRLRIKRLTELKVIVGYSYGFHAQRVDLHVFRLLIFTTGLQQGDRESLHNYCLKHPNIVVLIEAVGTWDYEIMLEIEEAEQSRKVVQEIYDELGDGILRIELLPVFRSLKAHFGQGYQVVEKK